MTAQNTESWNIAVIGCGTMGSGLAKALAPHHKIKLCDKHHEKAQAVAKEINAEANKDVADAVKDADLILLAVKPQDLSHIAKQLHGKLRQDQKLASILSGTTLEMLRRHFGDVVLLRMMPNIPCFFGEGIVGLVDSEQLSPKVKRECEAVFKTLGQIHWMEESKIDALTALGGSGPAFAFMIIESMVDAGIALGLQQKQAQDIAEQMFLGAITTLRKTGKHPGQLKWEVTSPGGCTIAGVKTMEDESVRSGIINTFLSTYERIKDFE